MNELTEVNDSREAREENLEHSRAIVVQSNGVRFGLTFLAHKDYMDELIKSIGSGETFSFETVAVPKDEPSQDGVFECVLTMGQDNGTWEDPTPDVWLEASDFKPLSKEAWKQYISGGWPAHWFNK